MAYYHLKELISTMLDEETYKELEDFFDNAELKQLIYFAEEVGKGRSPKEAASDYMYREKIN